MSENRLNGLTNINKKEHFDESEIIIEFARNSTKRMQPSEWSESCQMTTLKPKLLLLLL
jgi:hypothetical protein